MVESKKIGSGYIRVSRKDRNTAKGEIETTIINATERIKSYFKKNNIELYEIYIDVNKSGDDPNRPEFHRMRDDAKKGLFNLLVVTKLSRLTRSGGESQANIIAYFAYHRVDIISLTEDISNELNREIIAFLNKLPIIIARIDTEGMREGKKSIGRAYIKSPFGYKNLKKKKEYWKVIYDESDIVKGVFEIVLKGGKFCSKLGISKRLFDKILNNQNYVGVKLSDGSYKSIISHKHYIKDSDKKVIDIQKEAYFGFHEPLISPQDWIRLHPDDKNDEIVNGLL